MAQNVKINGVSYSDVPAIEIPKTSGGMARFVDPVGTKTITANGTYDVTQFASAAVNVPVGVLNAKVFHVALASDLSSGTLVPADETLRLHRADTNAKLFFIVSPVPLIATSGVTFMGGNVDISFAQDNSSFGYVGRRSSTGIAQAIITKKISDTAGTGCYILADGSLKWNIASSILRAGSEFDVFFFW